MTDRLSIGFLGVATALGIMTLPAVAQDEAARLQVSEKEPFGEFVVDGEEMSLYMLEEDTQGTAETEAASTCYDECAQEWPPLLTTGEPEAGENIDTSMLATIERTDGSMQVTYNGWPLYYYHDDQEPGDTTGQAVHDQWGGWYLIAPSGEPIEEPENGG